MLPDRDTNGNGTLDERLYALQDANYNVTAIMDAAGAVVERFGYEAYGRAEVMDGSWGSRSASAYDWEVRYAGYRWDGESGLYQVRFRYLHPGLGRWVSRDPLGYVDGMGLYEYVRSNPVALLDPLGFFGLQGGPGGFYDPNHHPFDEDPPANCPPRPPDDDCATSGPVGQPGFGESLIPVWGSARSAIDDFQNGRWGWGTFNAAMAATDVTGVKAAVSAGGKLVFRGGKWVLLKATGKTAGGQVHHAISKPIAKELARHPTLRGQYSARDPRFTTRAGDLDAHHGYQAWHRSYDDEVCQWLRQNPNATTDQFEDFVRSIYNRPEMRNRFPDGLP